MIRGNYKIIGIISFLAGTVYAARAFTLLRPPGELPMTNTYPLIIGILFCMSALGVYFCGTEKKSNFHYSKKELIISLLCFIIFTLTFEKAGTIKASFIFSLVLGTIWNRKAHASEETAKKSYLAANKLKIAENILVSCICSAGIWLVFERIFRLPLP